MNLKLINNVLLIGIGGIGMSGLAKYFIQKNKTVYGYDREESEITDELIRKGAKIIYNLQNIHNRYSFLKKEGTLIIYTPAISSENSLLNYFINKDFEIFKRSDIIQEISAKSKCIAIAGTHGKTTTTSILAHILKTANISFTAFVGGIMENYNSNFIYNGEEYVLVEADEYDKSFLKLSPNYACITSLDIDHLDVYMNEDNIISAFNQFVKNISDNGFLLTHENLNFDSYTYGENISSDFYVKNIQVGPNTSKFNFIHKNNNVINVKLSLTGNHNIINASAAIAIALELGVSENEIIDALKTFEGIKRRFSFHLNTKKNILIDDYAHHPEEINQIYISLSNIFPEEKISVVFQPHLYSRTRDLINEFAYELSKFDSVILLDIYPAREEPIKEVNSQILLDKIDTEFKILSKKSDISKNLKRIGNRVNITLGAGDISKEIIKIKNELEYEI